MARQSEKMDYLYDSYDIAAIRLTFNELFYPVIVGIILARYQIYFRLPAVTINNMNVFLGCLVQHNPSLTHYLQSTRLTD